MNNPKSSRSLLFLICLLFFNCLNANFSFDELNDYDAAKLRAGEDGKLIFIAFSAKWCMPCKILEESTLNNPEIKAILSKDYISVKIDIENQTGHQWKDKFQVQLVPTIIILDSKGKILNKTENTLASSPFKNLIESHNISQNKQVIYTRKQYAKTKYKAKPAPKRNSTSSNSYSNNYSKPYTKKIAAAPRTKSSSYRKPTNRSFNSTNAETQAKRNTKANSSKTNIYSNTRKNNTKSITKRKRSTSSRSAVKRKKSISSRSKSIAKKRKKASKKHSTSSQTIRKKPIAQGNVYKVKIGNYSKYDAAKKSLVRVQKLNLGNAKILEYKEGRKSRYKIIVGRFYQREGANSLLKSLNRKGYQGSVVAYEQ